jgi:hypothetical protein
MPAKRETNPFATNGASWPEPRPTIRIHTLAPVSLLDPTPVPRPSEEPSEAAGFAPAKACPITLTLDVQSPADELEPLSAEVFPPELYTPEFAPTSVEPPCPDTGPAQRTQGDQERVWTGEPWHAPRVSTGELLGPDPCAAEFVTFPADPRRQTALMRDVESMVFEEMMRRTTQQRPKASSSWMLLGAGAGIGAGVTALLSMLTLPLLIGALRGPAAPPSPANAAAPVAAQPSTVILSGFIPAAAPQAAAAAEARPAASPRRPLRDPPPGSLPVVEEWGRGRPLPPELAQAIASPSRAPSPAAETRDHQPAKDAELAAVRR